MVEHVPTCEQENSYQADGSPQIAVLQDRKNIWIGNSRKGDEAQQSRDDHHNFGVIDWPYKRRPRARW